MTVLTSRFLSVPAKAQLLHSLFVLFSLLIPFVGTVKLLTLLGLGQLVLTLWVFLAYKKPLMALLREIKVAMPIGLYLVVGWLLISVAGYLNALDNSVSPEQSQLITARQVFIVLQLFYVFAFILVMRHSRFNIKAFSMAALAGFHALLIFWLWLYHTEASHDAQVWFFEPLFAIHVRDIGNVAAVLAVAILVLLLNTQYRSVYMQLYLSFSLLLVWVFLLWTGGRMAIISSAITSVIIAVYYWFYSRYSNVHLLQASVIMTLAFFVAEPFYVFDWNGIGRSVSAVSEIGHLHEAPATHEKMLNNLSTGRWEMWRMSLEAVSDSLWLGLGPNGYYYIPDRVYGDQPHNLIIQFLVEWGIIGTVLMLFVLLYLGILTCKALPTAFGNNNSELIIAASIILVLSIHGLSGGTYFNYQPVLCLCAGFAVLVFQLLRQESTKLPS